MKQVYGPERNNMVTIVKGASEKVVNPESIVKAQVVESKPKTPAPKAVALEPLIAPGETWIDEMKFFGKKPEIVLASPWATRELENKGGKFEEVELRSLVPTQDNTGADKVRAIAKDFDDKQAMIQIFRRDGKNYIFDGTHTAAAAILAGRTRIKAKVINDQDPTEEGLWDTEDESDNEGDQV